MMREIKIFNILFSLSQIKYFPPGGKMPWATGIFSPYAPDRHPAKASKSSSPALEKI